VVEAGAAAPPTAEADRPVVLSMRDIAKTFSGVRALDGVTLTVHEGEVAALLGENGAGKSTLMNVLAGVFADYDGQIDLAGKPASIHSPRDAQQLGIGMIHQELNLVPELSIADNIFLGRELRTARGALDRGRMDARARELLAGVGLRLGPRRLVRQCRIAEQQLIEVAKALSLNVSITVIRQLADRGVAVVYISHRLEELEQIADSVTVLRDGAFVGRRDMAGTSRSELIAMMVGRPLTELFPRPQAESSDGQERLRVEHLDVDGDPRAGRASLHDIGLTVRAGQIVGLAGLMGAGRSEVLETVFGAQPRHAVHGRLWLDGRRYQPRSPRHAIGNKIALVAEDRKAQSLVLGNTVRFNASLSALDRFRRWGLVDGRRERAAVAEIVRSLRVKTPGIDSTVADLSGGNQQKVVLAKCLLTRPSLILMDEPTRGIDVGAKAEIYELMTELAAQGAAILMASSELPELLAMCDRILVLCEGRVTGEFHRGQATQETILAAAMARRAVLDIDAGSASTALEQGLSR